MVSAYSSFTLEKFLFFDLVWLILGVVALVPYLELAKKFGFEKSLYLRDFCFIGLTPAVWTARFSSFIMADGMSSSESKMLACWSFVLLVCFEVPLWLLV